MLRGTFITVLCIGLIFELFIFFLQKSCVSKKKIFTFFRKINFFDKKIEKINLVLKDAPDNREPEKQRFQIFSMSFDLFSEIWSF